MQCEGLQETQAEWLARSNKQTVRLQAGGVQAYVCDLRQVKLLLGRERMQVCTMCEERFCCAA